MRRTALLFICSLLFASLSLAQGTVSIDSVWFWEEIACDSRNVVEVCYSLSSIFPDSTFDVTIGFSTDYGATWSMPFDSIINATGDIGADIDTGLHCFEWEMGYDLPNFEGDSFLIEVTAKYDDSITATVPGVACLFFAGRPPEFALNGDSAHISAPVCIDLGDCIDSMVIVTAGTVSYYSGFYPPTGNPTYHDFPNAIYQDSTGISACDGNNICSFTGVFLDTIPPSIPDLPPHFPFDTTEPLMPMPQQSFYIGYGKSVIPPAGAIQLCLGVKDYHGWEDNLGEFRAGINRYGLCDKNLSSGILDSKPPDIAISCPTGGFSPGDVADIGWSVADLFYSNDPGSLFIDYGTATDTIIVSDTFYSWIVQPSCDSIHVAVAVRDSFCNWGYDSCAFLVCNPMIAAFTCPTCWSFASCTTQAVEIVVHDTLCGDAPDNAFMSLVVFHSFGGADTNYIDDSWPEMSIIDLIDSSIVELAGFFFDDGDSVVLRLDSLYNNEGCIFYPE